MCAHLCRAAKIFGRDLLTKKTTRRYVYRTKRGAKPLAEPSKQYLRTNPINIDTGKRTRDESSASEDEHQEEQAPILTKKRKIETRASTKTDPKKPISPKQSPRKQRNVGNLAKSVSAAKITPKRPRGRPRKVGKALEND